MNESYRRRPTADHFLRIGCALLLAPNETQAKVLFKSELLVRDFSRMELALAHTIIQIGFTSAQNGCTRKKKRERSTQVH